MTNKDDFGTQETDRTVRAWQGMGNRGTGTAEGDSTVKAWQRMGDGVNRGVEPTEKVRAPQIRRGFWTRLFGGISKSPLGVSRKGAWNVLWDALAVVDDENAGDAILGPARGERKRKQAEIIRWVDGGGNLNWTDNQGLSLLHYAAMVGNETIARYLLDHGAKVNARAKNGFTPLLSACKHIQASVIPTLLDRGADPTAQTDDGYTTLKFLRKSFSERARQMESLLISRGVVPRPGFDSPCPECGSPYSEDMEKRGVIVDVRWVEARFACLGCKMDQRVNLELIHKAKGINVLCSCGATTYVPPSVWCKTCSGGLSTGWQKQLS